MIAFREGQAPALLALAHTLAGRPGALDADRAASVAREVDAQVAAAGILVRLGLVLLLDVLRVLPLFVIRRPGTFETLGERDRETFLAALDRSRRLTVVLLPFKTLVTIAIYELPGELESVGYRAERRRYLLRAPEANAP